ncbi:uncharacterized protein [Chironomus tepperi]|uniref:uncharacterized protein n=1 Tax=Chironomus tepperi TaxID=113505 RepID=UPI00391F60DA
MSFAVVGFLCDQTCSVVRTNWLCDSKTKCHYPSTANFPKFIRKDCSLEKIEKWKKYDIIILHEEKSFDEANELAKYTSDFGDTEGELAIKEEKNMKRKMINMGVDLDLRENLNKLKENDEHPVSDIIEERCKQSEVDSNEDADITLQNSFNGSNTTQILHSQIDQSSLIIMIRELKLIPDNTNSKNAIHGAVATIIENLFTKKFITKRLKWGEMNGQQTDNGKIYLVNFIDVFEIAQASS